MKTTFRSPAAALFRIPLAVLSAAALLHPTMSVRAAIPAPEKLLPDDTLIVFTTPDYSKMREIYKSSPQTQLWNDPALKPFREKFLSKLKEELVQPLERDLGVRLEDYADLPQGQVTLAMTQNGWQGLEDQSPGFLLLLDARDKSSQLKTNLANLRRKWVDAGKPIKRETIRNVELSVLPLTAKDIPPSLQKIFGEPDEETDEEVTNQPPTSQLVFGQFESLLIVGTSTRTLEKVVAHLTGGSAPALGDVPSFEANRAALFREAPLYGWVNVKAFVDLLVKNLARERDPENPMAIFDPAKIVNTLGLGGLRTFAFNVQNSADGMLVQCFVGAPEATRQGLFSLFPAPGKDSGPPPFVPADATKFQRVRIDCQKAWAALERIVNDIYPGGLNMMLEAANMAAKEKDPDFDLRKNLINNLGDDMIAYEKAPKGASSAELGSPPSLFLINSPRAEQLAAAIKLLASLANSKDGPPAEREFLGRKIYTTEMPAFLAESGRPRGRSGGSAPRENKMSFTASGSYLAIGTDTAMLEEYLRSADSQQKSLRSTPGLVEATARVGGASTGWFGYENQTETTRIVFEALRKGASSEGGEKLLAPGIAAFTPDNPFKDWVDFSLWPPFEKIAKYFHFMVYSGVANSDGLLFRIYYPVPPQLKK